ncbi:hypothetical protein SH661x_000035 [Planctomicrobium sp. SH661]|uniref:hypothetical protein n=1 Tax=Planctomicrobium sp. SH661 TaxID=3448124 RepID=UPI003F5BAFA3
MLTNLLRKCQKKWAAEGIFLAPPVEKAEIERVWASCKTGLSDDVLELYSYCGGFAEYTFDKEFVWSLWPWEWLKKRNEESQTPGVMFCDHSIEIVTWRLQYESPQHSSVWAFEDLRVSSTLEEFFQQYLTDPWKLL